MVYQSRTQTEAQLENEMITQLAEMKYEKVAIPDIDKSCPCVRKDFVYSRQLHS